MKSITTFLIYLLLCVIVFVTVSCLLVGCAEQLTPQPKFYSETEKNIMFIPEGTRIGDVVAPEDGIFIGKSRILDMRIIEVPREEHVPEERKQKKLRT